MAREAARRSPHSLKKPSHDGPWKLRPSLFWPFPYGSLFPFVPFFPPFGVVPERRELDALHVAAATCFAADYLVSWNHRHMTRPLKRTQYEAVNRLNGYLQTPFICNPVEACDELRGR